MGLLRHRWNWVWLLAAAAPAVIPLGMILHFSVNFPFWDEWDPDIAGIYVKAHQHQLTFADLAAQHNEHRILVPRLIYLVVNSITHDNAVVIMLCGWFVAGLTSLGIHLLLRRTFGPRSIAWPWFLCNVLIFTPQQWQTWLWGMGLANLLPMMFIVLALLAADSKLKPWVKISVIVLLCSAATYTTGTGIVAWPLAGIALAFAGSWAQRKQTIGLLCILALACAVNVGLYLIGYSLPQHTVEESRAGNVEVTFGYVLQFVLAFVGNGFGTATNLTSTTVAAVAGTVLVLLLLGVAGYVAARWRRDRDAGLALSRRAVIWLAVAGYTLLNALLATATRARFGPGQAITPRYLSFGLYLELALVPLLILVWDDLRGLLKDSETADANRPGMHPPWSQIPVALLAIVALPPILSWGPTLAGCRNWHEFVESSHGVLLLAKVLPNNPHLASKVNPKAAEAVRNALALNELGYLHPPLIESPNASKIQSPPNAAAGTTYGKFEKIWKAEADLIGVSGWAIDPASKTRAVTVFLTCDDSQGQPIIFATAYQDSHQRIDVVQALGEAGYQLCGWILIFDSRGLPTPQPQTRIAAWTLDPESGRAYRLDGDVMVSR